MSTKGLTAIFSTLAVAAVLCLSACASSDMKPMDDATQKPMMKDSGKQMNNGMDKHDDMGGTM
jgi:outer membrane protein assembly factor BamE (lipoprotein component of BamABCDE complex)